MVVAFSRTTIVGESLRSRMEFRILQSRSPRWNFGSFSPASALDPVVGSEEEHPETSPTVVGEEANLPIGPPASSGGGIKNAIAD